MRVPTVFYAVLFAGLVILDRITKYWALSISNQEWSLNKYMRCDVVINRGISWSMFDGDSSLVFLLVSLTIVAIIMFFSAYTYQRVKAGFTIFPHIIILAGAVSNMVDRVQYHGVVDFIAIHCAAFHFPIFNVADICIVLGIFALLWHEKDS